MSGYMHHITDRQCLRHHHEALGRLVDTVPWTRQSASDAQARLTAAADACDARADSLDPDAAYGPSLRIRDDADRDRHHLAEARAAADIRRAQDDLRREAMLLRDQAGGIPQDRHDAVYVAWLLDHVAAVDAYAWLVAHPGDEAGMRAAGERVRDSRCDVGGARTLAVACLDRHAAAAGVPEWRRTYGYVESAQ